MQTDAVTPHVGHDVLRIHDRLQLTWAVVFRQGLLPAMLSGAVPVLSMPVATLPAFTSTKSRLDKSVVSTLNKTQDRRELTWYRSERCTEQARGLLYA